MMVTSDALRARIVYWASATAGVLGAVLIFTSLFSYVTRYSQFDSLLGVIDQRLYARITEMFPTERSLLIVGIVLLTLGVLTATITFIIRVSRDSSSSAANSASHT